MNKKTRLGGPNPILEIQTIEDFFQDAETMILLSQQSAFNDPIYEKDNISHIKRETAKAFIDNMPECVIDLIFASKITHEPNGDEDFLNCEMKLLLDKKGQLIK